MPIQSEKFNNLIGRRNTLLEIQKADILCPGCEGRVQRQLAAIQEFLESDSEMGVVTNG